MRDWGFLMVGAGSGALLGVAANNPASVNPLFWWVAGTVFFLGCLLLAIDYWQRHTDAFSIDYEDHDGGVVGVQKFLSSHPVRSEVHLYLRVKNVHPKRKALHAANVRVTKIQPLDTTRKFSPLDIGFNLPWRDNGDVIDLPPETETSPAMHVEFIFGDHAEDDQFFLCRHGERLLLPNGVYCIHLQASAREVKPLDCAFRVSVSGANGVLIESAEAHRSCFDLLNRLVRDQTKDA